MRAYLPASKGDTIIARHTVHVAPGADGPKAEHNSEWYETNGEPKQFSLVFANGVFDSAQSGVPDSVVKYVIAKNIAKKTQPLFRPAYA